MRVNGWKYTGLLLVILLPLAWTLVRRAKVNRQPLSQRQFMTQLLADHLAKTSQPKKVLVFSNPYSQLPGRPSEIYDFQSASEKGLKEGFGGNVTLKFVYPEIKPEALENPGSVYVDPKSTTPLSFLTSEDAWADIIKANPGYDLAISLVGVPLNYLDLLKNPNFTKIPLAVLLPDWRMVGPSAEIRREFEAGRIVAAIVERPGATLDSSKGETGPEEFKRRYLLLTRQNAAEIFR